MSVRTDVVNLRVNVGNNAAQNQLNDLGKKAAEVRAQMEQLGKRTKEYTAKKAELAGITAQMDKLKKQIGLTALTQKELVQEQKKLLALRNSLPPFTAEWKKYDDQLKQVKSRLYDVNNGVQGFASLWSKVGDEVKKFGALAVGYLGFQFITQQFGNLIRGAADLSDSLADIQKVTALSSVEIDRLNTTLKGMDTRTANEQLRNLAYEAGKLGITGREDIEGFVRAADQIQVALGRDLGDGATLVIGKIAGVYKAIEQFGIEEGMLRIGSAINAIGMSSAAQEQYIVDFTKRVGGIAVPANISAAQIIALAGTMDSLGATSEVSTTALGNTIAKMVTDFKGFAEVSGMTEQALRQVYSEEGGLGALRAVLEGVQKTGGNFDQLVAKLGDIGIEGSRAKAVLGLLANNLPELDRQIRIATDAFAQGTSVTNEFNIKNNTLGATLDKLGKEFNRLVTSSAIQNFLRGLIENTFQFIQALRALPRWINENSTALKILVGGIILLNAQRVKSIALAVLESKALQALAININTATLATRAHRAAMAAGALVSAAMAGNITKMAQAWRVLTAAMGTNPLGLLLIAAGATALAISKLRKEVDGLTVAERARQNIQQQALQSTIQERAAMMELTAVVKDASISLDVRQAALKELIEMSPKYLSGLTLENIATREGANALKAYNDQLIAKASLAAAQQSIQSLAEKDLALAKEQLDLEKKRANTTLRVTGRGDRTNLQDIDDEVNLLKAKRATLRREQDQVIEITKEFRKKLGTETGGIATNSSDTQDPVGAIVAQATGKPAANQNNLDQLRQQFLQFYDGLEEDMTRARLSEKFVAIFDAEKVAAESIKQLEEYWSKGIVSELEFTEAKNNILSKLELTLADIEKKYSKPTAEGVSSIVGKMILPSKPEWNTIVDNALQGIAGMQERLQRSTMARLDTQLITARGDRNRLDAVVQVLEYERFLALQNTALTEDERAKIIAEYDQRIAQERGQFLTNQLQQWVAVAQQAASLAEMFLSRQQAKEQAAFNREKSLSDQRKKLLKDQLDNRLISQAMYDKKIAELQEADDKRDADLKRRQFERAKKMQIVQAIIGGAQAIVSTLAAMPGPLDIASLGVARALSIGFTIATTAAQVAMISKQQPPEMARGGLLRRGPKHSSKSRGLQVVNPDTGQVEALVERNEAIMSSNTMDDSNVYTATGTPSQIASTLNGINGGNTWASPAMVRPISSGTATRRGLPGWVAQAPAAVRPIRQMADGGTIGSSANATDAGAAMGQMLQQMQQLTSTVALLAEQVSTWNRELHAVVSIKEYREKEALYDASLLSDAI